MKQKQPHVVVIAGPNGAGKSTAALPLLRDMFGLSTFVNADRIAQGLSGFGPQGVAMEAGRIMLERIRALAENREDFAFETTLAGRSFATFLRDMKKRSGYRVSLVYFWLPDPSHAVARVHERVLSGGHDIPEDVIRRRFERSLKNFFNLYEPLANSWNFIDNSVFGSPETLAYKSIDGRIEVRDSTTWESIREQFSGYQ